MPVFDFSKENNIPKPIPSYTLSDDEDELRNSYAQYQDDEPYFSDYNGSGNEYEPDDVNEDNESTYSTKEQYKEVLGELKDFMEEHDIDDFNHLKEIINKYSKNNIYYDILFKLPKKERIKILYNLEFKEEFLEKKRQRNLNKLKYEINIKVFKKRNKYILNKELKVLKEKQYENSIVNNIDMFIKDFMWYYNNNLVQCKQLKCKNKCANDVGYCLEHYPDVCEKCNYICNKTDIYDKLTNNIYYQINNFCNKCTTERHKEIFIEKYPKDKLFYQINEKDKLNELFSTVNFENLLTNKKIYDRMIEIGEKDGLSISELRNKICETKYLSFVGLTEDKINAFTKYELWRKYDKSADLINTFSDKLKYINITDFRFRKWGTLQYNAFKEYLFDILYENDPEYNKYQNICNNILEDVTELDTLYPADEIQCANCGTNNILPNNTLCLSCKFST